MTGFDLFGITATLLVLGYYLLAWLQSGRDPNSGTIVPAYEPPRGLSPAAIRYIWREGFDDRVFWAAILSLVAKGLATIKTENSTAILRPTSESDRQEKLAPAHRSRLPVEERILLNGLIAHHKRGIAVNLLDGETAYTVTRMCDGLRDAVGERWFRENRQYVIFGASLSLLAVCITAHPRSLDQLVPLVASLGLMAPAGFYLPFLLARLRDLLRVARRHLEGSVLRRALLLLAWIIPCCMAFLMGGIILGGGFSLLVLIVTFFLAAVNLLFLRLMKAPTIEGRKLLDEIAGFREFLTSVEKLPMDRSEAPEHRGLYEKYLPYAVALEVEQSWSDRFIALASSVNRREASDVMSCHIGMWDGRPVEIFLRPEPVKR